MDNLIEVRLSFREEKVIEGTCHGCFFYHNNINCSNVDELNCAARDRVDNNSIIYKLNE